LTLVLAAGTWGLWAAQPIRGAGLPVSARPLLVFLAWAWVSLAWSPGGVTIAGLQNLLVMTAFAGAMALAFRLALAGHLRAPTVGHLVELATWTAIGAYVLSLILDALGTTAGPLDVVIGSRTFALVSMVLVGYHLVAWRFGSQRGFVTAMVLLGLTAASLSRTALMTSLLLIPASRLPATA
jgi:hypothetical protein